MQDVVPLLNGRCTFKTCDGSIHAIEGKWDMIIAFPPCTYLTVTGNRWFDVLRYGRAAQERWNERCKAVCFFMRIACADCDRIAIENPIGCMSTYYRKPDQIVHPYMFGDPARKATCFWLKDLPKLVPTNIVEPEIIAYKNGKGTDNPWHMNTMKLPPQRESERKVENVARNGTGYCDAMGRQVDRKVQTRGRSVSCTNETEV